MPELAVRKITTETMKSAISIDLHTDDEITATAAAIAVACEEIYELFHGEAKGEVLESFIRQGMCLECLALWGFRLGVACVNEQLQQDRLKVALAINESGGEQCG